MRLFLGGLVFKVIRSSLTLMGRKLSVKKKKRYERLKKITRIFFLNVLNGRIGISH